MTRFPIMTNNKRLHQAILDVDESLNSGHTEEQLPELLRDKYLEDDIRILLKLIKKLKNSHKANIFKSILKVALWILLLYKILFLTSMVFDPGFSWYLKSIVFFIGPILNIAALYLVYRENQTSYLFISCILLFMAQGAIDIIENLFKLQFLSLPWTIDIIQVFVIFLALICVYIIIVKLPTKVIRITEIIKSENINSKNFV